MLDKFRLDRTMKWASNFSAKQIESDSTESKETKDWMTWWGAADLWRIPENMPDRQAMAVERCAQFVSRPHPDLFWGLDGILQYDMAIGALMTTTRIDSETRTLESYVDLK